MLNNEVRALNLPSSVYEEGAGVESTIKISKIIGYRPRARKGAKLPE